MGARKPFIILASLGALWSSTPPSSWAADPAADNSRVNVRDRSAHQRTADDQAWDSRNVETVRKIREALVQDESLSSYAKNIKIIATDDGQVTLKGPVNREREKTTILRTASGIAGPDRIASQIDVLPRSEQ